MSAPGRRQLYPRASERAFRVCRQSRQRHGGRPGETVAVGGENHIAVFAISQDTVSPHDSDRRHTRVSTTHFCAGRKRARLLVGNQIPLAVRDGSSIRTVPESHGFQDRRGWQACVRRDYPVESDPTADEAVLDGHGVVGINQNTNRKS